MIYCNTDPNTPAEIREKLDAIEAAFGDYVTTDDNPCGGCAYFDTDDENPWRVHYADGVHDESFATAEEAIEAASNYADEMGDA